MTTKSKAASGPTRPAIYKFLVKLFIGGALFSAAICAADVISNSADLKQHLQNLVATPVWAAQQLNALQAPIPTAYEELGSAAKQRRAELVAADRKQLEVAIPVLNVAAVAAKNCLAVLDSGWALTGAWKYWRTGCATNPLLTNDKLRIHGADGIANYDPVAQEIVDRLHELTPLASTEADKARLATAFHQAMAVFIGPIDYWAIHTAPNAFADLKAGFIADAIPVPHSP